MSLQVTGNMAQVVRGMDRAMESMNPERISAVMDKFEAQFEDLDVQSSYMESAMGSTTATATPQDEVDLLLQKVADEAGLEMNATLTEVPKRVGPTEVEEDKLGERLRALRS